MSASLYAIGLVLAVGLFLFDFQNLLGWWRGRTLAPSDRGSEDFTVVVPVWGDRRYFDERVHLSGLKPKVLVALDVGATGMAGFADELEAEGWRVERVSCESPSPPALILAVLERVDTTYLIRMDADTRPLDQPSHFVAAMEKDGADVCSVKVLVQQPRTVAARFQALEYRMAMLSRHYRAWLTSGACTVAKTKAWRAILARHSMWTPGEDIETGRIAVALRLRIRHLDLRVETDAPATWPGLFAQRRLWWAGNFRHMVMNFDKNALQLPVLTFYYVALVYVGVCFKWWTLASYLHPFVIVQTLAWVFAVYALITIVANLRVFSCWMLVFPPYALVQSILMPVVGAVYYVVLAQRQGRLGRYRLGYRRERVAL